MIAALMEVERQVEIVTCYLPPITHRIRLRQIRHLLDTRNCRGRVFVNCFGARRADNYRQIGNEWQNSQNSEQTFHSERRSTFSYAVCEVRPRSGAKCSFRTVRRVA